ncbi:Protein BCP1 [Wickerhamiella sorbophila]|uniref:Protein BCP1 n=1 Tax=Wickerhamiella sorbophila TaxID=45607 RepID=A0A2T0FNC1_9ASCO|nr:Protein BCP1 [Wickerhamiella sorbophila]PRT56491.1 Protein BCP1 [Wickerhamiella sorbophila]
MGDTEPTIKKPLCMSTSVRGKILSKKNQDLPRINLDAANTVAGTPSNTTCTADSQNTFSDSDGAARPRLSALPQFMEELPHPEVPEPRSKRRRGSADSPEGYSAKTACLLIAQSYALGYLSAEKRAFEREVGRLTKFRNYLLHAPSDCQATAPSRSSPRNSNRSKNMTAPECPPESVLESLVSDFADKIFSEMSQVQSPSMARGDVARLLELVSEAQVPVPSASLGNFFRSVYDKFGAQTSSTFSLSSNKPAPGSEEIVEKRYTAASDAPAMPVCDGLNGGTDSEEEPSDSYEGGSDDGSASGSASDNESDSASGSEGASDDSDASANDYDQEDEQVVNADFDFFDLSSDDFLSIKNLLRSLLESDHLSFDLSQLTDYVIENSTGITVKSEGSEGDPLGLLAIVDLSDDAEIPKKLKRWLVERTETSSPAMSRDIRKSTSSQTPDKVALILQERLLNLPFDLLPYFYQLTLEELKQKGHNFTKYIVLSRVYSLEPTSSDSEPPAKKTKQSPRYEYFHAEDVELQDIADSHCFFPYENKPVDPESRGTQENEGLFPAGHALLLSADAVGNVAPKLSQWVAEINSTYSAVN